jgi:hypothetical protein
MRPTYHLAALLAMCVFAVSAEAGADLVPMKEGKGKSGPSDSSGASAPSESGESPHALALRARWVTVPGWSIKPYLETGTQLDGGWSVGMEYLYRRTGFDVVVSADYSWLNAADGNYLAKNHPPATDVHYLHFDKLSVLSADVSLIGHWNVLPWMEIRAGAGLGLGVVFGDIYQITNFDCTLENAGDPSKCHPRNVEVNPNDPATVDRLVAKRCDDNFVDGGRDTPSNPCYRRTDTYPFNVRVVPVINTLLGLRFRPHKNVYVHLEAGWRLVGFYLGAGPEFRF